VRPVRKADILPPSCAVVTKSGSLNFLEPSGPVQACNGTGTMEQVMVPVVARSKAWVCGRLLAEIVGSNPAGEGMDICVL